MDNLKQKTVISAGWSFFGNTINQLIRFGIGIVLARILMPAEYGLVGMLAIFLSIGDALVESGFSAALIQKKDTELKDFSTVFYLNLIIALFLFCVFWISAPLVARFYNEKILQNLVVILSIGLIIRSFTLIQNTILIKNLQFREISILSIISTIISGFIAIPMALNGYGVWTLVCLSLTKDTSYSIMLWLKSKWKPRFIFDFNSLKSLFGFGSRILGIGLLDNFFLHINKLIIGKFFTAADLGFYTRAYGYRDLISKNILSVINSIAFPSFAIIQKDLAKVKKNYIRASEITSFITIPLLMLMVFIAEPLIRLLITEKWLPTVPYLQILCFAGIFYPISGIQVNVFKAIGKVNEYLLLNIVHKASVIIGIIIGINWGVVGLVYAQVFSMLIVYLVGVYYIKIFLGYNIYSQLIDFIKYFIFGVIIFSFVYLITSVITKNDLTLIVIQSLAGLILYFFTIRAFNFIGCMEAVSVFKEFILPKVKIYLKK